MSAYHARSRLAILGLPALPRSDWASLGFRGPGLALESVRIRSTANLSHSFVGVANNFGYAIAILAAYTSFKLERSSSRFRRFEHLPEAVLDDPLGDAVAHPSVSLASLGLGVQDFVSPPSKFVHLLEVALGHALY